MKNIVMYLFLLSLFSCYPLADTDEVFSYLHTESESLYDGAGTWGETQFTYKMPLRDSYWRADVYGYLSEQGGALAFLYGQRADAAIVYILTAQSNGGAGVFGFPSDANMPEFGDKVAYMQTYHTDMITNGWIVNFPTNEVQQLYYDHGYALYSVARAFLRTGDSNLIHGIIQAADWTLDKPMVPNLNYLSALAKGLCLAYSITHDPLYLSKAIEYHTDVIIPGIGSDGQALDSHNAQMEYHAFIVSGLVALRQQLTNGHPQLSSVSTTLERMVDKMLERTFTEADDWEQTWLGTNLQAWYELSLYRELDVSEREAVDQCLYYIRANLSDYKALTDYAYRKSLYANFFIGYWL